MRKRPKPRNQNQGVAQVRLSTAPENRYVVRKTRPGLWAVFPRNGFHKITEPTHPKRAVEIQCRIWNALGRPGGC